MDAAAWRRHRLGNAAQSLLLLAAMALVVGGLGWVLGGASGLAWALGGAAVLVLVNPGFSPRLVLSLYGAHPIPASAAPEIHDLVARLARRAELPAPPRLYYVPSRLINAFAVGTRTDAALALTDGLLRGLAPRELAGVLAHEVSHLRHNDTWVMGLADLFSRLTSLFSSFGQILFLLNLPLLMFSHYAVSWGAILILVFAPAVSALMQLALARTREYDADLSAAELTGDPRGLASALARMERYQGRFLEQIFLPGQRVPDPSLLRTHPPTEERVRRLLELEPARRPPEETAPWRAAHPAYPAIEGRPRRRLHGTWY